MTTEIGHINLRLPPGFAGRAQHIGRLVGEALARRELPAGRVAQIGVGPLTVEARRSDHAIARQIAETIHTAIGRHLQD
jgi:hypothetical protein